MIVKSKEKTFFCIIADHLRTVIFALMDGATFEPKGRGYVIRKLVKKIVLLSFFLKFRTDDLILISKKIIELNSYFYVNLNKKRKHILKILEEEIINKFSFVYNIEKKLENYCKNRKITSSDIFFLYDTLGIPLEFIENYTSEKKINFSKKEFDKLLSEKKIKENN